MKISKLIVAASVAAFFASASFGASYLKFDGVQGESKDKDHQGWSDVVSVTGLEARDAASGLATGKRDHSSGMATGKRQHKPLVVTKHVDKSSPLHAASTTSGTSPLYSSRMTLKQDGVVYLLTGVKVLNSKKKGDMEVLTLAYASIEIQKSDAPAPLRATDYNSSRSNKSL